MAKHTEGLLRNRKGEIGVIIVSDDQSHGMMLSVAHIDKYDFEDAWEANARRLVACWNRLEMFCTEDIEDKDCDLFGAVALEKRLTAMTAQRDELLTAMIEYLPYMPKSSARQGGAASHSGMLKAADTFRDAIASAEQRKE